MTGGCPERSIPAICPRYRNTGSQFMAEKNEKKEYVEPTLTKQQRLADVVEGAEVLGGSA